MSYPFAQSILLVHNGQHCCNGVEKVNWDNVYDYYLWSLIPALLMFCWGVFYDLKCLYGFAAPDHKSSSIFTDERYWLLRITENNFSGIKLAHAIEAGLSKLCASKVNLKILNKLIT